MDTSETYTKMCEKAWSDIKSDAPQHQNYKDWYICKNCGREGSIHWPKPEICQAWDGIWLPRQDQLQEMVKPEYKESPQAGLWYQFKEFITNRVVNIEEDDLPSWEQLWLAFVMKEKFGKEWINGDWVNKKDRE